MPDDQVRGETLLAQGKRDAGDGLAARQALDVMAGQRHGGARAVRIEGIGPRRDQAWPRIRLRHDGDQLMPAHPLQGGGDMEELAGEILVEEEDAHFVMFCSHPTVAWFWGKKSPQIATRLCCGCCRMQPGCRVEDRDAARSVLFGRSRKPSRRWSRKRPAARCLPASAGVRLVTAAAPKLPAGSRRSARRSRPRATVTIALELVTDRADPSEGLPATQGCRGSVVERRSREPHQLTPLLHRGPVTTQMMALFGRRAFFKALFNKSNSSACLPANF